MINKLNIKILSKQFKVSKPYSHVIIDNFWSSKIAKKIAEEIKKFSLQGEHIYIYDNPIEKKVACNNYDKFPPTIYRAISFLNSNNFINIVKKITKKSDLSPDIGLHGGGIHIHPNSGKLNIHKDYSIHPKLGKQRLLNLICYMTPNWNENWGGHLELWSHNKKNNQPLNLEKKISNRFNRVILFDTTQNSWHGLPQELKMPKGVLRQSLAVYYLTTPKKGASKRDRALYAPTKEQINNKKIIDLIKKRSSSSTSLKTYIYK